MSKTKPKHAPKALQVPKTPAVTAEQDKARLALRPSVNGASVIEAYQSNIMGKDVDMTEMVVNLAVTSKKVNDGDLRMVFKTRPATGREAKWPTC